MAVPAPNLPVDEAVGDLEVVARFVGAMPTGVTVSKEGRIFVCFPKWGDPVVYTVGELHAGSPVAFPNEEWNRDPTDDESTTLVSVQSVVVDPADRLWIVDTGSPMFRETRFGGPKLVCVNLATDEVEKTILFPEDVALPTSYLNDIRFDLRRGEDGVGFITDSSQNGPNGIIAVDLATGESIRRLDDHPTTQPEPLEEFLPMVEGRPVVRYLDDGSMEPVIRMGSDGIAISADGDRLYYSPLASRRLYSVSTDALLDVGFGDLEVGATISDEGDRGGASDGLESDATGHLYSTNYEHDAILRRSPDGAWETLVHDPRLLWPDTMSVAEDGYLYVTANQLHRQPSFHDGQDLRRKPYALLRVRIGEEPVKLI